MQQSEADLGSPKQRFAWAFRGIEVNSVPVGIPDPIAEAWSVHLSKTGAVHIDQVKEALAGVENAEEILALLPKQEIHYQPPLRGQDHTLNTSGEWIPVDQPIRQPLVPTVDQMTPAEKQKMIGELKEAGLLD